MGSEVAPDAAPDEGDGLDWHRRVVGRSLQDARRRSIDRGARFIRAAAKVLERTNGNSLTVQEVADEAGQSLRTLYQYFESKDDLLLAVFEEAMRTYGRIMRDAIAGLDEPVERLAGGIIASVRLAAVHHNEGRDRGLSYVRMQLAQADPALVARSQEPVTAFFRELVTDALAGERGATVGPETATWFVASLRSSVALASTLGNDLTVDAPDAVELATFCLAGLGLERPRKWYVAVEKRLRLRPARA
jgi:AcrR family transcriptional regulator